MQSPTTDFYQKYDSSCVLCIIVYIGVPDRGAGRAVAPPLGFEKLVKFGQMRWEIRAFRGLNFSR